VQIRWIKSEWLGQRACGQSDEDVHGAHDFLPPLCSPPLVWASGKLQIDHVPRFSSSLSHFLCLLNLHCLFKKISIVSQMDWLQRHRRFSSRYCRRPLLIFLSDSLPPYCTSRRLGPSMDTLLGGRQVEVSPAARAPPTAKPCVGRRGGATGSFSQFILETMVMAPSGGPPCGCSLTRRAATCLKMWESGNA
jgi:hypothetical protein